jgi:hypothetical protein
MFFEKIALKLLINKRVDFAHKCVVLTNIRAKNRVSDLYNQRPAFISLKKILFYPGIIPLSMYPK